MTHYSTAGTSGAGDWIVGTIKRNPEGLLLLAAGCALLLRSGSSLARGYGRDDKDRQLDRLGAEGPHARKTNDSSETMANVGRGAREYLSDVADKVSETAKTYTSTVADYADDAVQTVSEQSGRLARQAQSGLEATTEYVLQEQPLAVAIIGLAAGAAVGAAFPPTELERVTLGSTGQRLRDAAGQVSERVKDAGAQAGERLMSAAEERGLTTEGLKEVARDVGDTFSDTLTGDGPSGELATNRNPRDSQSSQQGQKSGSQAQPVSKSPSQPNASAKRGQR